MGTETQDANPPGGLTRRQVQGFMRVEPITLGFIQILVGVLFMFLGTSLLTPYDLDPPLFISYSTFIFIVGVTPLFSGAILIHAGRRPSLCIIRATLVFHFVSLAFSTAIVALLSDHLPYRQNMHHCDHCMQQDLEVAQQHCFKKCTYTVEQNCKYLIDGVVITLVVFEVLELLICIVAILFGLQVLTRGRAQASLPILPTKTDQERTADDRLSEEVVEAADAAADTADEDASEMLPALPYVDPPPPSKS
ncbi:uncharacterized protein LOC134436825 [Engraulis encrasicolus]|uniref:uncharacterized protein LOC134436825 n=1 Tax=Engraulis encrasicolus TaxID=184585 RepID=UPI002FD3E84A